MAGITKEARRWRISCPSVPSCAALCRWRKVVFREQDLVIADSRGRQRPRVPGGAWHRRYPAMRVQAGFRTSAAGS
ncbi:Hypothetical protein I596_993 [Dokdonella koreensis DS-123]|uniref:Uncharacterized protein n=2 Tax=Dokdonella TaxID=323413 RepID=A0A160DTS6_9GAMM|nr:Hypothetical protein I596_993 [Dokdonella koreensis DS-123]